MGQAIPVVVISWDDGEKRLTFEAGPLLGQMKSEELRWLAQEMATQVVALLNHADMLDGLGAAPPPVEPTDG